MGVVQISSFCRPRRGLVLPPPCPLPQHHTAHLPYSINVVIYVVSFDKCRLERTLFLRSAIILRYYAVQFLFTDSPPLLPP